MPLSVTSGARTLFDPPPPRSSQIQMEMARHREMQPASAPLKDGGSTASCLRHASFPGSDREKPGQAEIPEPSRKNPNPKPNAEQLGAGTAAVAAQAHSARRGIGGAEADRRRKYPKWWGARGRCGSPCRSHCCRGSRASSNIRPPPPPPSTSNRSPFVEGASEQAGGAAQGTRVRSPNWARDPSGREGGGSGWVGAGPSGPEKSRVGPSIAESARSAGPGQSRLREPTRAARWARSGAAGRTGRVSSGGGRGGGSEWRRRRGRRRAAVWPGSRAPQRRQRRRRRQDDQAVLAEAAEEGRESTNINFNLNILS